jgi:hypothetical protein
MLASGDILSIEDLNKWFTYKAIAPQKVVAAHLQPQRQLLSSLATKPSTRLLTKSLKTSSWLSETSCSNFLLPTAATFAQ